VVAADNPRGQAHRRRYEELRWRMLDLKGKDAPTHWPESVKAAVFAAEPSGATECEARNTAQAGATERNCLTGAESEQSVGLAAE